MAPLDLAAAHSETGRHWPDWQRVRIDVLDALGSQPRLKNTRWAIFERSLDAEHLRAHLKRLQDFDDERQKIER